MPRHLLLAALLLATAACGQKGALYFRNDPPPGVKPPKPDPYKPVPYPKTAPEDEADGAPAQ